MDDPQSRGGDIFGGGPRDDAFDSPSFFFHGSFDVFQPFRDIMQSFFSDINPEMPFESIGPSVPERNEPANPRDRMLRQPDVPEEPSQHFFGNVFMPPQLPPPFQRPERGRRDSDLDGQVTSEDLQMPFQAPRQSSFFHSFSSRTIRTADGKVEEECRVRDSSGKEEKVVRRVLGDKSHTITTRKKPDGEQEVIEDLVNMDEDTLPDFNKNWNGPRHHDLGTVDVFPQQQQPSSRSGFMDVFAKFFGFR